MQRAGAEFRPILPCRSQSDGEAIPIYPALACYGTSGTGPCPGEARPEVGFLRFSDVSRCGCGGGFTGIPIIPEEAEPCNTGEWQNIDDNLAKRVFSNPQIMEQLKDMIEQSALGGVEKGGRIVVTELALGGFAVKFEPLSDWGTIVEESCTHINFVPDVSIQEGNYTIHTHMPCPGVPYPDPMPSSQDRETLREHNFEGGIIIDMKHDKIITYGPDVDDNDPGQQEDTCGSVE